jgi:hypothetical protein
MPGLLQTYEYAHAMYKEVGLDDDEATEKATARAERRVNVEGADAKHVTAILDEPVLNRAVGTPEVMCAQLAYLLELSLRPNVVIQVVREARYFPGLRGQFEIASGHEIPDTLVMYNVEDQTQDDPVLARKAAALFERIRGYAHTIEESRAILQEALQRWNSQQ